MSAIEFLRNKPWTEKTQQEKLADARAHIDLERAKRRKSRRISFRGRRVALLWQPRNGVCNRCRAVAGEIDAQRGEIIVRTDMHHETYHLYDPLRDAIELCDACHNEEAWRIGQKKRTQGKYNRQARSLEKTCPQCNNAFQIPEFGLTPGHFKRKKFCSEPCRLAWFTTDQELKEKRKRGMV